MRDAPPRHLRVKWFPPPRHADPLLPVKDAPLPWSARRKHTSAGDDCEHLTNEIAGSLDPSNSSS